MGVYSSGCKELCFFLCTFALETDMLKRYYKKGVLEAGCDEAGRGCLAGPVFAAAVILPPTFKNKLLNDSKQLHEKTRYALRTIIEEEALAFAVAPIDVDEIYKINILNASILAMHKAVDQLKTRPECLLIDGNRFKPYAGIPHHCIIKGDALYLSIAAASVLAKTYRDDYMLQLHDAFPRYAWNQNKGYGTELHQQAIAKHGVTPHHRLGFKLHDKQLAFW